MPFWLLLTTGFATFLWWTNGTNDASSGPAERNARPFRRDRADGPFTSASAAAQALGSLPPGLGGKALLLALMWRMGPGRSIALLSSLTAAWPMLQQMLQWGSTRSSRGRGSPIQLTREEAARLLDIEPSATRDEVEAAYRRLMARVHPDAGGNAYLAQLMNAARTRMTR